MITPGSTCCSRSRSCYRATRGLPARSVLEDYDINVGRHLVQGVDVGEQPVASTRGPAARADRRSCSNGGLNMSILDGWWPSRITTVVERLCDWRRRNPHEYRTYDRRDGDAAARPARDEVIPMYYDRDRGRFAAPLDRWMKRAIRHSPGGASAPTAWSWTTCTTRTFLLRAVRAATPSWCRKNISVRRSCRATPAPTTSSAPAPARSARPAHSTVSVRAVWRSPCSRKAARTCCVVPSHQIVVTLGPSTERPEQLRADRAGVDVMRLNMATPPPGMGGL